MLNIFVGDFNRLSKAVHRIAEEHGWWNGERNDGECIALMHGELSEALEAIRDFNPESEHIPEYTCIEEELADVIIRIMDFAAARGHRVGEAVVAKIAFNAGRDFKHGGKSF